MSGESVITEALRKTTNAWRLVIGTGSDYKAGANGIIGMMFNSTYADSTLGFGSSGLLRADVRPFTCAPRDAIGRPEAWIVANTKREYHEEVAGTPRLIADMEITARFRCVTGDSSDVGPNISNFDIEYIRKKYVDMVRDASKPAKGAYNFGLTTADGTPWIYMVEAEFEMPLSGYEASQGGYAVEGNVKHIVKMIRS